MFSLISKWTQEQTTQIALVVVGLAALGKISLWLYRTFKTVVEAAEFLQHELKENSGRSLRDYAVRTDARIEYLFQQEGIEMPEHLKSPSEED